MTDPKKPLSFDPLEHLPSLRAPRVPKFDPKADTIPAPPEFPESGELRLSDYPSERQLAENTPVHTPSTKQLLAETLAAAKTAANEAIATRGEVSNLRRDTNERFDQLSKRVTALELSQRWIPIALALLALALSAWQAYQVKALQLEIEFLRKASLHEPTEATARR